MPRSIPTARLLTQREARKIEAALALVGLSSRAFANQANLRYTGLRKVLQRKQVPNEKIAAALERLLRNTRWPSSDGEPVATE